MAQKKESDFLALDSRAVKELIEAGVQRIIDENKSCKITAAIEVVRCMAEWGPLKDEFRVLFCNSAQGA